MDAIEEKRVFADRAGGSRLLVAAAVGLVAVEVSAGRMGRFGVVHRCSPTGVAAAGGLVGLATDEDVLVGEPGAADLAPTGFGPATAVGVADGEVVAAGPDGGVARLASGTGDGWSPLGHVDAPIRGFDPPLVADADGVHRLPGLDYVGLHDVNDVASAGPFAATGDGLYSLGNGWMDELAGDVRAVSAAGDRAHAATRDAFFERRAGDWHEVELPADGPVADVAHGDVAYAVTADGVVVAEGEDGWRATALGVDGVVGCVVV